MTKFKMLSKYLKKIKSNELIRSCKTGNYIKVLTLLKNENTDINYTDNYGRSAIFYAIIFKFIKIVNVLTICGARIDIEDKYGRLPMSYVTESMFKEALNRKIENGNLNEEKKV